MRVEVINTGTELLLGSVLNSHLRSLSEVLFPLGLRIERQIAVPDGEAIRGAIAETAGRADVVFITGGLGPTTDDITRETVADWLGIEMIRDEAVMRSIEERFARRRLSMSPRNARQADHPREATVLPNAHGTAPGLYLPPLPVPGTSLKSPHLFLLPGPPRELQPMLREAAEPILRRIAPLQDVRMRLLRIAGVGESAVEHRIGAELLALDLELGYCARPGEVDVRLIGAPEIVARAEAIVRAAFPARLVSDDHRSLEQVIVDLLTARGQTVATAESCTGGALAHRITNAPGASRVYSSGFVTYANAAKVRDLDVDAALLKKQGAVSERVAIAMCQGARRRAGADFALSTTGIAGPDGGSAEKPVGTVYVGFAGPNHAATAERHFFPTERETFKALVVQTALETLRRALVE
jgi:nicotinamide-nucleotide amidase